MNHKDAAITFQFISEPSDVNFGGKVHGGVVMKWIDQTAYTCARNWAQSYCVTVYVGGTHFYRPINIGEVIQVKARIIHTGNSSMHIAVDVWARDFSEQAFEHKTHCVIVFVNVNEAGKPQRVRKWVPETEEEKNLETYALKLKALQDNVNKELLPFFNINEGNT